MSKPKLPGLFVKRCRAVTAKRPRTVIAHILRHGFITTQQLKDDYGYNHPPRAVRDVKEHGIPIEMFRVEGIDVSYLGASTPADALAQFLRRHRPDALVLSCSLPLFFGGVTRLADAAHASGGVATTGAAVSAGLAVAALGRRVAPPGTIDVGARFRLPPLPSRDVVLHSNTTDRQAGSSLKTLAATIRATADF